MVIFSLEMCLLSTPYLIQKPYYFNLGSIDIVLPYTTYFWSVEKSDVTSLWDETTLICLQDFSISPSTHLPATQLTAIIRSD